LIGQNLTTYWAITGENTVQITNVDFVGFENLTGGTGSDFFQLWNANSKITGKLFGGDGNDRLTALNRENTWNLNAARGGSITDQVNVFESIELLIGGTQADTFLISPLAQFTSLDAGTGDDAVDFSAYNATVNLNMATQSVSAVGRYTSVERFIGSTRQDSITAPNSANTWEITGASSGTVNALRFESFEVLRGGSGADQFTLGPSGTVPQIVAGGGADTLRGADRNNTWRITGIARGTLNTATNFTDVEHLVGGVLDDSVEMTTAGRITGSLTGGAGTNSLSYRTYSTAVSVNGTTGVATNIVSLAPDFQILIGGSGADALRAFPGVPSVLVGNAGNDLLTGSTARDILIGGLGIDTLYGGGDEDILIGGSTSHDIAPVALANLRAEWTSTRTYNERIGNLQGTSTTGTPMNNETYLRNTPTDTLLDDNAVDSLYGEDDLDWFIAKLGMDLLPDRIVDELVVDPTDS
jgi:Ca2+-binding RTX toxin-like protein